MPRQAYLAIHLAILFLSDWPVWAAQVSSSSPASRDTVLAVETPTDWLAASVWIGSRARLDLCVVLYVLRLCVFCVRGGGVNQYIPRYVVLLQYRVQPGCVPDSAVRAIDFTH